MLNKNEYLELLLLLLLLLRLYEGRLDPSLIAASRRRASAANSRDGSLSSMTKGRETDCDLSFLVIFYLKHRLNCAFRKKRKYHRTRAQRKKKKYKICFISFKFCCF